MKTDDHVQRSISSQCCQALCAVHQVGMAHFTTETSNKRSAYAGTALLVTSKTFLKYGSCQNPHPNPNSPKHSTPES